ncbi:hypothetical protein BPOR_0169g00110 [Botrytis porri]|uniref:Uncharacterized protein n=1 Tax=Botrytis porri TaxID=87229 RepID=A0A4Z1KUX5_9HELO|nr:hypothetical protein BPOR_0169g00110 [Botrytis porri]
MQSWILLFWPCLFLSLETSMSLYGRRCFCSWFFGLVGFSGFSTANEWLMIEEGSAILGACVPTFRPILKAYFKLPKSVSDWFSSTLGASMPASKFSNSHSRTKPQPSQFSDQPGPSYQLKKLSTAHFKRGREWQNQELDTDSDESPLVDNRIWVTRHITITK